jgi:hypothetical protein
MFRIALRYLLVTVFVSGVVALIWWGHASDHIKHVDYVPPPITAPGVLNPSRTPRVSGLLNRPTSMLLSAESIEIHTCAALSRAPNAVG